MGLGVYFVLVGAIEKGLIDDELIRRYIVGHSVSKVTTAMFLVGLVSLLLVGADVLDQFISLRRVTLHEKRGRIRRHWFGMRRSSEHTAIAPEPSNSSPNEPSIPVDIGAIPIEQRISRLQERLLGIPRRMQRSYLWKRFQAALGYVKQHHSAGGLDDELKYLSDNDANQKFERYSLVRILIWATPMLGFLGTVLGISEALGGIAVGPENDFQSMMAGLQSSLYIAFDTTALALTFSIILMFCQFVADRFESQLLIAVDEHARTQLNQFFTIELEKEDGHLRAIRQMGETLVASTERLVTKQCSLWNHSILAAQASWVESLDAAKHVVQVELSNAINNSTSKLALELSNSISKADKTLEQRIHQWHTSLSDLTRQISRQHEKLAKDVGSIDHLTNSFTELRNLQENLLSFLSSLPASSSLQETSTDLASAIRLLEFRIEQSLPSAKHTGTTDQIRVFSESTEDAEYDSVNSGDEPVAQMISAHDKFNEEEVQVIDNSAINTDVTPMTRRLADLQRATRARAENPGSAQAQTETDHKRAA